MNTFFLSLITIVLSGAVFILWRHVRKKDAALTQLLEEEKAIVEEERRMFSFLHDLGESISREDNHLFMYRLIVEGAMKVMESTGGALYLLDSSGTSLVPKHHTERGVPLVNLPARILELAEKNETSLSSFLLLHSIPKGAELIGSVYESQKVEYIEDLAIEPRLKQPIADLQKGTTAIVGPLSSGNRKIGVLAVTAPSGKRHFSANDLEVFHSVAEQCAFALAHAMAHQAASEKKLIEAELKNASEIQRILLPTEAPSTKGLEVAGKNIPARVLSGDYFDFIPQADGSLSVVIADVSGKGTAAALISGMCRTATRCYTNTSESPSQILARVNRLLYPDIIEDMFITMIYLHASGDGRHIKLTRAGHTKPLLWSRKSNEVKALQSGGLAVGIDKGVVFERVTKDLELQLEEGDTLLLYTDGVNEAVNRAGEEFGEERIRELLAKLAPIGPEAVVNGLIDAVDTFCQGKRGHDDITLVALRRRD